MESGDEAKLKRKILLLIGAGAVGTSISSALLILLPSHYFLLLFTSGMVLLLVGFFSIKDAPAEEYLPEHQKLFFIVPLALCVVCGVLSYVLISNMLATIIIIIGAVAVYTLVTGKVLLNFSGYKIYSGIYAYAAGTVFLSIALAIFSLLYFGKSSQPNPSWPAPEKNWQGQYQIDLLGADSCQYAAKVTIENVGDLYYTTGQYAINISPIWNCFDKIPVWQIRCSAVENGDSLLIWNSNTADDLVKFDTIFIWVKSQDIIKLTIRNFTDKPKNDFVIILPE
jgi:hypothetical protein